MAEPAPDLLDELFHACALRAFLEVAARAGGPPASGPTRRRAYELYEAALAARHAGPTGRSTPAQDRDTRPANPTGTEEV